MESIHKTSAMIVILRYKTETVSFGILVSSINNNSILECIDLYSNFNLVPHPGLQRHNFRKSQQGQMQFQIELLLLCFSNIDHGF